MVKNLPANVGDTGDVGSIPGSRRSPEEGHGNPLQCSCLENPMDGGPGGLQSMESQRVRRVQAHTNTLSMWTSLPVQWLRLCAPTAWGLGSISGGEIQSRKPQGLAKKRKKKECLVNICLVKSPGRVPRRLKGPHCPKESLFSTGLLTNGGSNGG